MAFSNSYLSEDGFQEALRVVQIQDYLSSLTKENYPRYLNLILETDYIKSPERAEEFAHHIVETVKYRVKNVATFADLLQQLQIESEEFPALKNIEKHVLNEIAAELTSERVGRCAMQLIQFLSKCFIRKVYTNAEIMKFIRSNIHSKNARQIAVLHIFSHFCYLIEELDPPLYNQHIKIMKQIATQDPYSPVIIFLNEIEGWRKDNWFALKTLLSHDYNGLTLEGAMIMDDLPALMNCAAQPEFSPDGCMQTNLFTPSNMLETHPTIIQYAAYFGSIKCFKYLLSLGADISIESYPKCSTINFASAGGNMNIIKILDDKKINFKGASQYAAMYYNYDLLVWAIENKDKCLLAVDQSLGTAFECAATSNFIKGMLYLIEKGADVNVCKTGSNPLFYACVFGQIDTIRLLLSHKDINPDVRDAQGVFISFLILIRFSTVYLTINQKVFVSFSKPKI
ncbi:hypothetical protein TRFO_10994 [Tritrichomonas foetus]|uniref:Uncharacterized protein n=1 Tax=Tritrichomonas foetus TaxID=1144522 RepID=A0A1J4JAF6_9EUKA|nr:hypothetical protein TRFO_10994 [Tritrichomonas foetus]|eukprot:OHS94619.1 hypothetical protein TRFO_10994 [Tritrichomonas foetus]